MCKINHQIAPHPRDDIHDKKQRQENCFCTISDITTLMNERQVLQRIFLIDTSYVREAKILSCSRANLVPEQSPRISGSEYFMF